MKMLDSATRNQWMSKAFVQAMSANAHTTEDVVRAIIARLIDGWQPGDALPELFL